MMQNKMAGGRAVGTYLLVLVAALGIMNAQACVHLMGMSPDSKAPHPAGSSWTYDQRGDNWNGLDANNKTWSCLVGSKQSPINLVHPEDNYVEGLRRWRTSWSYSAITSNGSNVQVYNNGHTIQVQWGAGAVTSNVSVVTSGALNDLLTERGCLDRTVTATPIQFHFHTDSEHTMNGVYYPLELHIVHVIPQAEMPSCPASGCLMVTGIMLRLDDNGKDNELLKPIWDIMPLRQGVMADLPKNAQIKLNDILPSSRDYTLYEGSLTTPPCTEGVLWHVMSEPITISLNQLRKFQNAVGFTECELKNGVGSGNGRGHNSRRLLSEGADSSAVSQLSSFQRGAYSGFVHAEALSSSSHGRSLLAEGEENNPDAWNCSIASVGFNNRNVQPLGARRPMYFRE